VYAHLFGASLTYSFSSYFANWAIDRNIYYSGSLYDIPLVVSMAWFTFAGVTALHLAPPQQPGVRKENHGVWVARFTAFQSRRASIQPRLDISTLQSVPSCR